MKMKERRRKKKQGENIIILCTVQISITDYDSLRFTTLKMKSRKNKKKTHNI